MGSLAGRPAAPGRPRRYGAAVAALLAAVLTGLALAWAQPAWLAGLQERSTDRAWALVAEHADERRLIMIDIDEASLREVGPWPWPRAQQARLLDRLAEGGAAQQVLDVVFPDARPDDAALQRAISTHKPVLAQVFALPGQGDQTRAGEPGGALPGLRCPAPFGAATGFVANDAALTRAATAAGAPIGDITPRLAHDGVVRYLLRNWHSRHERQQRLHLEPALAHAQVLRHTRTPPVHQLLAQLHHPTPTPP